MTEKFYYDFHQVPSTGVEEPDLAERARTDLGTVVVRPANMKVSRFGDLNTRPGFGFKDKGESEDWSRITEDTGIGQNVRLNGVSVNHNPHILGDSIKYGRNDQFVMMGMSRNTGTATNATDVGLPGYDIMDPVATRAEGILGTTNYTSKNWPSEGWRSFGGKYDFAR